MWLRYEVEYSQQHPSVGWPRKVTVGHLVDMICDVHMELDFISQTAVERPRDRPIERTGGQHAGDLTFAVFIGDEGIFAAVLSAQWASRDHTRRERRRIKRRREDGDPSGVETIGD